MESYNADGSSVKDHTICLFDNATIEFRVWKERIELYIMSNGLYTGILDDGDPGDKKTLASRSLQCYAIICMNLSDSCKDVVRRTKSRDPKICWEALIAEFDQRSPTTKLALLESLIDLKAVGPMIQYISSFNVLVESLQSMNVSFDEDLLLVLLMRGLPVQYEMLCSSIRHREAVPKLSQFFAMLVNEEKLIARKQVQAHAAVTTNVTK
jgi:hypothetical protein